MAGFTATIFLRSLDWVTNIRDANIFLIWGLPLAGLLIGYIYQLYGKDIAGGNNLILQEIHDPKTIIPLKMSPLIFFSTVASHLFGASVGREGTVVQIGASLSDQISKRFKISSDERKSFLVAGAGAGFGAAIGVPWAGVIFGMEVISIGRLKLFAWYECLIASFVAYLTTNLMGVTHVKFLRFMTDDFGIKNILFVVLAGILFGLFAQLFSKTTHFIERKVHQYISFPPFRPCLAGVFIVILYYYEGTYLYTGLGLSEIQRVFYEKALFQEPFLKTLFTALAIGSGFKGGEFTPLVFIGTTLGSALSNFLPLSINLLTALGFAAVFAGASNTPLACTIMAIEIFGLQIAPFALIACFASYYVSGHHGIYKTQKIYIKKHQRLYAMILYLGELPKRFFNGGGK